MAEVQCCKRLDLPLFGGEWSQVNGHGRRNLPKLEGHSLRRP
jgi:hypothetical protein